MSALIWVLIGLAIFAWCGFGAYTGFRRFMRNNVTMVDDWSDLMFVGTFACGFALLVAVLGPIPSIIRAKAEGTGRKPREVARSLGGMSREEKLRRREDEVRERERRIEQMERELGVTNAI